MVDILSATLLTAAREKGAQLSILRIESIKYARKHRFFVCSKIQEYRAT